MGKAWIIFKKTLAGKGREFSNIIAVMRERNPVILDLRNPPAFKKDSINGSMNISIDHIYSIIPDLIRIHKPVIVTSQKGVRSEMATSFLKEAGVEAYDGGPWSAFNQCTKDER